MTRLAVLHARARYLPEALLSLALCAAAAWWLGDRLMERPLVPGTTGQVPLSALAPLIAAGALVLTLGGADERLERSTPARWPLWRAGQVIGAFALAAGAFALVGDGQPALFGAVALVRGAVGFLAIATLAASAVGRTGGWAVAAGYGLVVVLAAPQSLGSTSGASTLAAAWAWPVQAGGSAGAGVSVAVLATLAVVVHGRFGARPVTDLG